MKDDLAGRRARLAGAIADARRRTQSGRDVPRLLAIVGAILLPLGFASMALGWYGASHTPYEFEQIPYLLSGGLIGLGLVVTGCGAYVGAWVLHLLEATREQTRELRRVVDQIGGPADAGAAERPASRGQRGSRA